MEFYFFTFKSVSLRRGPYILKSIMFKVRVEVVALVSIMPNVRVRLGVVYNISLRYVGHCLM